MRSSATTRMGLGTAPLGGLFAEVSPQAALDTVDAAWDLGVRFFDTAPLYGSGLAEERLGQALSGRPRDEYTVSTKVGRVLRPGTASPEFRGAPALEAVFDFSADGVRRSLAGSLRRLRLDAVDVLLLHDPEEHMEEARRAIETMRDLAPPRGRRYECGADRNHLRRARRRRRGHARGPLHAARPFRCRGAAAALRGARRRAPRRRRLQQRRPGRRHDVRLRRLLGPPSSSCVGGSRRPAPSTTSRSPPRPSSSRSGIPL